MEENNTKNQADALDKASESVAQKFESLRDLFTSLKDKFIGWGIADFWAGVLVNVVGAVVLVFVCWISYLVSKRIVLRVIRYALSKTENDWDNILIENKVFSRLTNIVPAMVVHVLAPVVFDGVDSLVAFVQGASKVYLVVALLFTLQAVLASVLEIYQRFDISRRIPIKGLTRR